MIRLLAALAACAGAGCSAAYASCADVPAARLALAPAKLSQTGLYADGEDLAPGVTSYRPRFELWSDGASKRRFVWLPPGTKVDTSNMDAWQFPRGTKLWKEFARDGVRVETRYMEKTGDDEWLSVSYVWKDGDATPAPEGDDAKGVPAARRCAACHGGAPGRVLGISAVQLEGDWLEGRVTRPVPKLEVPGNATERAALGYLHANCAHCHNTHRPAQTGPRCFDPRTSFDLSLRSDEARLEETGAYRTARGAVIEPGDPSGSALFRRVRGGGIEPRMPALGTLGADPEGVALLGRWITELK